MKKTTFKQCAAGDVFEHQGQALIKTTKPNTAVNLNSGAFAHFHDGSLVDRSDLLLSALQLEVEKEMGFEIDEDLFAYLEHYARRKLEVANKSAGRAWGEDGYGDEYLSLLIPDVIREMAFSAYCDKRSAENLAARKAVS